jgi:hypothetical protein
MSDPGIHFPCATPGCDGEHDPDLVRLLSEADQLRDQGHEAMREMRTWPERMRRNLPADWLERGGDEVSECCPHPRREHKPRCACGCDYWKPRATMPGR